MRLTLLNLSKKGLVIPMELPSHTERVKSLYKKAYRSLESHAEELPTFRYEATLLRHRFDLNKNIKDVAIAKQLLLEGEKEQYENEHPIPIKFPFSPGGVAYERETPTPDWVLDYWHPLEKAKYPDYFKKREERKKEFVLWWEKQYGKPNPNSSH